MKKLMLTIVLLLLTLSVSFAGEDKFASYQSGLDSPSYSAFTVVPDSGTDLAIYTRGIYVGGTGDVVVTTAGGDTVTFVAVPAGLVLPVRAKRIWATSTATFMLGLY